MLFRKDNTHKAFQDADLPIGFLPDNQYKEQTVQLQPGDRLYLYSDGINEAMNKADEQFGHDRLIKTFKSLYGTPLKSSIESTIQKVHQWSGDKVKDDMSILAIEII